jgi:hypothetical protein
VLIADSISEESVGPSAQLHERRTHVHTNAYTFGRFQAG